MRGRPTVPRPFQHHKPLGQGSLRLLSVGTDEGISLTGKLSVPWRRFPICAEGPVFGVRYELRSDSTSIHGAGQSLPIEVRITVRTMSSVGLVGHACNEQKGKTSW